jgi:hypothetical protein
VIREGWFGMQIGQLIWGSCHLERERGQRVVGLSRRSLNRQRSTYGPTTVVFYHGWISSNRATGAGKSLLCRASAAKTIPIRPIQALAYRLLVAGRGRLVVLRASANHSELRFCA